MKFLLSITIFASVISTSFMSSSLAAGEAKGWKEMLASELVVIRDNKMTIEGYDLCTVGDANLQVKTYSEAPNDGAISRDYFVAMSTMLFTKYFDSLGDDTCKDIDAPIGNIDIEFSIMMTDSGIKLTSSDHRTNTENTSTVLWSDIL